METEQAELTRNLIRGAETTGENLYRLIESLEHATTDLTQKRQILGVMNQLMDVRCLISALDKAIHETKQETKNPQAPPRAPMIRSSVFGVDKHQTA